MTQVIAPLIFGILQEKLAQLAQLARLARHVFYIVIIITN